MSRIMGDSTTLEDIPLSVQIVGTYINGSYGVYSPAQVEARFPHARYGHVLIDVNGSRPDAEARDWETGDKEGSLEDWVRRHNAHTGKKDAVIYCDRDNIPEVRRLTASQILASDYYLWVATLDGTVFTGPGVMGCQCKGEKQTGGHWDESEIFDDRFWRPTGGPVVVRPKPNCATFQKAVRVMPDNSWGPRTDKNAMALMSAATGRFPYGIIFAQQVVGAAPDGVWGPKSKSDCTAAVKLAQLALKAMGFNPGAIDGIWGVHTGNAYLAARQACHV